MAYTGDDLLRVVRRRSRIPDGAIPLSDSELLEIANDVIVSICVPFLKQHNEEYFVKVSDTAVTSGVSEYRIPSRAQGAMLRSVSFLDSQGKEHPLSPASLDDIGAYTSRGNAYWPSGKGYCFQGDKVILFPEPTTTSGYIRFRYFRRPSRLTLAASAAAVSALTAADVLTCTSVPAGWSTSNRFDIVQANPNFDSLNDSLAADSVTTGAGGNVNFTTDYSTDVAIGDYIALANESPVIQLPVELHPVLVSGVAAEVLETLDDRDGAAAVRAYLGQQLQLADVYFDPRSDAGSPKVVNRNSPLRGGAR